MARNDDDKLDVELAIREDDVLLTLDQACAFVGGELKPIDRSTYYRGVARGIYPAPIHPSPGISRIVKRHLAQARSRTIHNELCRD